jgi:isoquinoline 1-oxidoreductase beta subunit
MSMALAGTRRDFLIASGAVAGGGLLIGFSVPRLLHPGADAGAANITFRPNAFLRISGDGTITVTVAPVEMGQGVHTAIAQLIAEELDADWESIRVEPAPTDDIYNNPLLDTQATGNSSSVRGFHEPMRRAGATARVLLVQAAAAKFGVAVGQLRTENGAVLGSDGRHAGYGELAAAAALLKTPVGVTLKSPQNYRLLGQPLPRKDLAEKVNGTARYGLDVRVPGMLTALVLRPPVLGAKAINVNSDQALALKGVKQVVELESGVAVLATGFHAARQGRDALRVQWGQSPLAKLSSESIALAMARLSQQQGLVARNDGNVATTRAARTLSAVYDAPYLAHAALEPLNCTVSVTDTGIEVWAPTQSPGLNRAQLAKLAGVALQAVVVHTTCVGGSFGRKSAPDFVFDAMLLSRTARAPVQLVYTREDDMRAQHYRPAARVELRAGLDARGLPVSFSAHSISSSVFESSGMIEPGALDDAGVAALKHLPYDIPNVNVQWSQYEPGVKVWFWRSVGSSQNVFFAESFIDEMAYAAGIDPYDYRRGLLAKSPRHMRVLDLAAEKAGWGSPLPAGRARGIAVAESSGSYVAEVAEVSLGSDGKPRVHRVVCAIDCGTTVNPGIIVRQAHSAIAYGLSAALYGKITLKNGSVEQGNFNDYPVLRINAMPAVEVHIVPSTEAPGGVGEPPLPPLAPAVANALFALNGKRIRSLPLAG